MASSLGVPGYNPSSLQDVINQSMGSQTANLTDQYTQQKKQMVADQASSGRLMSGVSDYPLTDLQTQYQQGLSGIQNQGAQEEAGIPEADWLNNNQFQNSLGLANQIGQMNQPSTLDQVFQGIGTAGQLGGMAAGLAAL